MSGAVNERSEVDGIGIIFMPGNPCMMQRRHRQNDESKRSQLKYLLFAEDTTILSGAAQMDKVREKTKKIMSFFEERTNDSKEENLVMGEESAANTRFLGMWPG